MKSIPRLLTLTAIVPALVLTGCDERREARVAQDTMRRLAVHDRLIPPPMWRAREGDRGITAEPSSPLFENLVLNNVGYPAATLPAGNTRLNWSVEIPSDALLEFGHFATTQGDDEGEVSFSVHWTGADGQSTRLYNADERISHLRDHLVTRQIHLSPFVGKGTLSFRTVTRSETAAVVSWKDPLILAPASRFKPNVVIVCVDTLRADRLTSFGATDSRMPFLDQRLNKAVVFQNAYANSNWSLPSMASILTGLLPGAHHAGRRTLLGVSDTTTDYDPKTISGGIELIIRSQRYAFQKLHTSIPTLHETLGENGYYTAAIHNNGYINPPTGVLKGIDFFEQYPERDAKVGTDRALDWLDAMGERRFFLFLHYIDPHQWPRRIPKAIRGLNLGELEAGDKRQILSTYDHLIEYTDKHIERFLKALEELDIADETLVVFLADHGERFFEKGVTGSHGGSFLESVIRVPLAIWGPGFQEQEIHTRVNLVDVVPTILDSLELESEADSHLGGTSLIPLLEQEDADRQVISEFVLWSHDQYALIDGPWKYVLHAERGRDALYNLESDSAEERNLIDDERSVARRLRGALANHIRESRRAFEKLTYEETQLDEATLQSLRALGYID